MRHLFVPACACLMTLSGAVTSDPNLPREHFTNTQKVKLEIVSLAGVEVGPIRVSDAEHVTASATGRSNSTDGKASDSTPAAPEKASDSTPDVPELAIEYPAPGVLSADAELPQTSPLPLRRPPPWPVVHRTPEEICRLVTEAAEKNSLPAPFFIRLLFQESRFKPGAVSPSGALGIAQFMPETSASMGVENPFDPLEAIPASARLLRELLVQFGNLGLAAAAYNAGPGRIQDWLNNGTKLPKETESYVATVTGSPVNTWKNAEPAEHLKQRLPRLAPCQKAAGLYAWNGPEHVPVPSAAPLRAKANVADKIEVADKRATKTATKKNNAKTVHSRGAVQLAARERKHRHRHRGRHRQSRLAQR